MTPPSLDIAACEAKLVLLADLLADLERQGEPEGADLRHDRDRRHVVERILTHLVDIAAGLNATLARGAGLRAPTGYRDGFELLGRGDVLDPGLTERLLPSTGMRNLLTHEYGRIDLDLVAAAVPQARRDFADYVRAVRARLRSHATRADDRI